MADQYSVKLDIQFETIKALKDALALANKELEKAKVNTVEWGNAFEKVGQLKGQMTQVNQVIRQTGTTMQGTTQASSNAAMALLNLNYVIRDSPYFFNNFALGVLAVGNNLNPLIDSFSRLRQEAGAKSLTTFALLRQALVGGAGISIAFSLVVTAIQSYVFATQAAKKETKELKEAFEGLDTEFTKFIEEQRILTSDPSAMGTVFGSAEEYYKAKQWVFLFDEMNKKFGESAKVKLQAQLSDAEFIKGTYAPGSPLFVWADARVKVLKELLKVYEDVKPQKDKVEKITESWKAQPPLLKEIIELLKQYNAQMAIMDLGGGVQGTGGGGLRPSGGTQPLTNPFEGTLRDIKKQLDEEFKPIMQAISEIANTAGNAIANAFLSGKNAIDAATQALLQFITQLLVVQALKGILTSIFLPGGTFIGGFLSGFGGLGKTTNTNYGGSMNKGVIRVEGNLRADGNEFIAGFNKSVNIYNRNVKGSSLGHNS